jgi:RNA 2',3'-cyclic 3'-phosphodiesterase
MRLFVAVDPDAAVRQRAVEIGDRVVRAWRASGAHRPAVSWVKPENLHLTLRFLGEVDDARAEDLARWLKEPLTVPACEVEFSGLGVFPPGGPPRVIWIGVSQGAPELERLAAEIERHLESWGFGRADRSFQSHLTIGRCRQPLTASARDELLGVRAGHVGRCRIEEVVLYRSLLSPAGSRYVAIARAPLAAAT